MDANGNYVMGEKNVNGNTQLGAICLIGSTITPSDGSGTATTVTSDLYSKMSDIKINSDGSISATINGQSGTLTSNSFSNITIATFVNPNGLNEAGNSYYSSNSSSGAANYIIAGSDNSTEIRSGELEMSNVDLSQEMTNMIVAQRGFQANSRVISVSDSMLKELVNLKRA